MLGVEWQGPGYHTRVPNGAWAHPTRESLAYALDLLRTGEGWRVERAATIVRQVLTLQDTDPLSPTYGIWPWLLEEPLAAMAPPDWNWADFCGALLAEMLAVEGDALPGDLAAEMRASLGHAAWSIFRRPDAATPTSTCPARRSSSPDSAPCLRIRPSCAAASSAATTTTPPLG